MRLALLSPTFPPDRCGVADHTAALTEELVAQGHEVAVWTAQPHALPSLATVRSIGSGAKVPWNVAEMSRITREVSRWHPEALLVQFTGNLYAKRLRGISPLLPPWIAALRRAAQAPVALLAHEQHYPAGLFPVDRLLIGVPQLAVFQALCAVCDLVLFSTEVAAHKYVRRYPLWRHRFHWLPVGSNIPVAPSDEPARQAFLQRVAIEADEVVLLQFGTPHPTRLFAHALAALEQALRAGSNARLIAVGVSDERLEAELDRAGKLALRPHARALGYLQSVETSYCLQRADLVLSPFLDGVSSRRGSVMAALAHGRPIVATRGWSTDPDAGWETFLRLPHDASPEAFALAALALLDDPSERERLARSGQSAYRAQFDWPVLAARITGLMAGLAGHRQARV